MARLLTAKTILILVVLFALFSLIKNFPEETVLVFGVLFILLIGWWVYDAYKDDPLN